MRSVANFYHDVVSIIKRLNGVKFIGRLRAMKFDTVTIIVAYFASAHIVSIGLILSVCSIYV